MAAAVRSAQVPGPEPGLGARCLWAPERRVAGAPLAVPKKAQPLPVPLECWAFPEMDKDLNMYLNTCPWCPCQGKGEEHQPCALFHPRHKPSKRQGTSLGLETSDLGNFGFPGVVADFSSESTIGLEDFRQSWREKGGLRSSCPHGLLCEALEPLCPAVSVLRAWHSSSPGAPPWRSSWVILQLPCIPVVINGTPGAKQDLFHS